MSPARIKEFSLVGLIVFALVVFNLLISGGYLDGRFFNRVTVSVAITALVAAGEAVVIIARNVDLSVGSIVGVSAYVTGDYLTDHPSTSIAVTVALALAIGAGLGLVNGTLVAIARVPAIITTLGTLAIYRAVLTNIAGGQTIYSSALPDWLSDLPSRTVISVGDFDLRVMFAVALAVAVILQLVLARARWGRWIYAIGSNPDAARQAGLPERAITLSVFVISGALSGLAGLLLLGQIGNVNVTAGAGLELAAIAAAVVGGVSIQGGSGTVIGALLGALLISILDLSLVRVEQVSEFWRDAILGGLILGAIVLDAALGRRLQGRGTAWEDRGSAVAAVGQAAGP